MFRDRVNEIFTVIGATSADIARCAGCDHSNISRIASGARVPKPGGVGAARLVRGICAYAEKTGTSPLLAALVREPNEADMSALGISTMAWLYSDYVSPAKQRDLRAPVPFRAFGEKLSAVMEVCSLSNVRLGRLINMDTSYVSRFKNGLRSPRSNPQTMGDICSAIVERALERGKAAEICALIKCPATEDRDELYSRLYSWLYADELEKPSPSIEKLLEDIDTYIPQSPSFFAPEEIVSCETDAESVYIGKAGLQSAVIRFLSEAIRSGAKDLFLYSDQSMEWMTEPDFRRKWTSLMFSAVQRGIKIHVIHNVDRDVGEMIAAINAWLPLYMSGAIDSYYLRKERSARFSTTFFLCPGVSCIKGVNAAGLEAENADYRYDTDPDLLLLHRAAFDALLADAKSLVKITTGSYPSDITGAEASLFSTSLSLCTMPETVLKALLDRCRADEDARRSAISAMSAARELFDSLTAKLTITEFIPVADDETLYAGSLPADVPGVAAFYQPEEYSEHIRAILELMETRERYRFCPLPDAPFPNTRIFISEGGVWVSRLTSPLVTFRLNHPAMCEAFRSYAEDISARYMRGSEDTKNALEKYL